MDSALLFSTDPNITVALEKIAAEQELRFKLCSDFETAKEWLAMRQYSLLLLPSEMKRSEQRSLAEILWQKSADAPCVLYDRDGTQKLDPEFIKLEGFSLIQGGDFEGEITQLFQQIKKMKVSDRSNFQIMVVEDLDSPRDIICVFIESLGYPTVVGKRSANDALKELESNPDSFSCIITDIRMPKINGVEFIDIVRHHDRLRHLPIIVLTAHGTVDILVDSLCAGASGFLVKPPKKSDLVRELSRATRISAGKESPRLASHNEAEHIRRIIEEQGLV